MDTQQLTKRLYSTAEAARYLGYKSPQTLRAKRHRGDGPPYHRLGDSKYARAVYTQEDLDEWVAKRRFSSTAAETQAAAIAAR